jgi:hypothetical protein
LESGFQGAGNSGRPLLLEGGLDWKAMSLTPKDMDFLEAKHTAAREIALALGVPPMLLAIPGDNTFSNYQEANRTFWRQTVIPLVQRTAEALSTWLAPAYAEPLTIRPDTDSIEALSIEREALWTRLEKASFLTTDEKRAAIGYGPMPADQTPAAKFNPYHAADGRFDFSPDGAQPAAFRPKAPTTATPQPRPASPTQPAPQPPPGKQKQDIGVVREDEVAKNTGGKRSGEQVSIPGRGSTDIDVVSGNGNLVAVGGPSKANNLSNLQRELSIYKEIARQRGVGAEAHFEEGTPDSAINLAKRILGSDAVKTFKKAP